MTNRRTSYIYIISCLFIFFTIWIFVLYNFKPIFENKWSEDPLAMLRILYPIFFIFVIIISIFCFIYIRGHTKKSNIINIVLLIEISLILLYTPIYMTGWVFSPDPIRNMVASENIEKISYNIFHKGTFDSKFFNTEIMSYPGSSIFNYIFIVITNVDKICYIKFIFPIFALISIITVWYIFVRKLFGDTIALFSGLIAISTFFYYKLHPSPYVIGFILLLMSFYFLIIDQNIRSYVCLIITIVAMVVSHPISPIMLEFYLVVLAIFGILTKDKNIKIKKIKFFILLIFVIWIFWSIIVSPIGKDFITQIYDIITLRLFDKAEGVQGFITEDSFIYPEIHLLNKLIYVLMLAIAYIYLLYQIILKKRYRDIMNFSKNRLFLLYLLMHGFLISMFMIVLWGQYDLLERSLTLYVFVTSIIISHIFIEVLNSKKLEMQILVYIILTLFMISGPIINYSSSAYNSFPMSERQGLYWLSNIDLKDKNLFLPQPSYHQLSFFIDPYADIRLRNNMYSVDKNDLIIFRKTNFYYISMRKDMSFDNNTYTITLSKVDNDKKYIQIYSNRNFNIYAKS